jgi:hypothetical protein
MQRRRSESEWNDEDGHKLLSVPMLSGWARALSTPAVATAARQRRSNHDLAVIVPKDDDDG